MSGVFASLDEATTALGAIPGLHMDKAAWTDFIGEQDPAAQKRQVDQLALIAGTPVPKDYWAEALPILTEVATLIIGAGAVAGGIGSAVTLVQQLARL